MKPSPLTGFIIKALSIYIIWFVSYDYFIAPDGSIDAWLDKKVAKHSSSLLRITGFNSDTVPGNRQTIVRINNNGMVGVGNPCNGLELFVLFAGFILCFPGPWKKKAWFIPLGILIIHFINVLRSAGLALIQFRSPESLDFNHHYTFTIIVYSIIFMLWIFWVNKFSGLFSKEKDRKAGLNAE
jgi:exosortase family protein XrtF